MAKPTIFFLGATGGCTLTSLALSLDAGYTCVALVRDPSKLLTLLHDRGISDATIAKFLTIHAGDALNVTSVKSAILVRTTTDLKLPEVIISGLGGAPQLRVGVPFFTIDNPTICQTGAATLVSALRALYAEHQGLELQRPLLAYISTGGMYPGEDDIPWLVRMLYEWVLYVPWEDKKVMERVFGEAVEERVLAGQVVVKPTMLVDGEGEGTGGIRVGCRRLGGAESGYTVRRRDVGGWMFREVVEEGGKGWVGERVTITN